MSEIKFPQNFNDLADQQTEQSGFFVEDKWSDLPDSVEPFIEDIKSIEKLTQSDIDTIFNVINFLPQLSDNQKRDVIESIFDIASQMLDMSLTDESSSTSKNSTKIVTYFLVNFCHKMENIFKGSVATATTTKSRGKSKSAKAGSFQWQEWRAICLEFMFKFISVDQSRLWSMGVVHENFLMAFWRYPLDLLESKPEGIAGTGKVEVANRKVCSSLLAYSARHLDAGSSQSGGLTAFVTALVDSMTRYEHMTSEIADLCAKSTACGKICSEIMGEIGRMNMSELSKSGGAGVKNVGCFLTSLAESSPGVVTAYLPLVMNHLDSEVYQIRSAVVTAMGLTIGFIYRECSNALNQQSADDEASGVNLRSLVRLRDDMLDILVERTRDVNAFTRAAVLKVWVSLVEHEALPVVRIGSVAEVALDRMSDKTAAVRKGAVALMTALLDFNPFSGSLNIDHYRALKDKLEKRLQDRMQVVSQHSAAESETGDERDIKPEPSEDNVTETQTESQEVMEFQDDPEIVALSAELSKCISCLELLQSIDSSVPVIEGMIASRTSSDVIEALRFFSRAVNFGVSGSARCLQSSFSLIWHQEESIQMECLNTFVNVFVTDGGENGGRALAPAEVAHNLVTLCLKCSDSDLTSFEKIVGELFNRKIVSDSAGVIQCLWKMAVNAHMQRTQGNSVSDSTGPSLTLHGPLLVLRMISKYASEDIFGASKIRFLCTSCLEMGVELDTEAMRAAAMCLQCAPSYISCATKPSSSEIQEIQSSLMTACERLLTVLSDRLNRFDTESATRGWFAVCEESVYALYHCHPCPDEALSQLITCMYSSWHTSCCDGIESAEHSVVSLCRLARLVYMLGQGALSTLLYTEKIANLAKKANEARAKLAPKEDASAVSAEGDYEANQDVEAMEEEMGMAAAADAEHEKEFNSIVELELVCNENNILGKFHPMVAYIVANANGHYAHPIIRETAVLSLCRYMSVSSILCQKYLPLFFTVLERESCERIRTSMIIAAGDLCFRFPNEIEPWTSHLYSRLSDSMLLVRYNTLMVLTHLILNDMIKVKGQVSAVVMCLVDESDKIQSLARLFFTELSKRSNNPVYNLLGDVIGNLSRDGAVENDVVDSIEGAVVEEAIAGVVHEHRPLTTEEFQTTMQFLLSFVTKDKQADSLLERLLMRITAAHSMKQKRNLAYCISRLPITDKGVKRMTELLRQMKDSLLDKTILESFRQVVSKAKKTVKGAVDVKEAAAEFDEFVTAVLNGDNTENISPLDSIVPHKPTTKTPKKKTVKKAKTVRKAKEWDSDEDDAEESDIEDDFEVVKASNKSTQRQKKILKEVNA
mmetsp:Transcript_8464/g.12624  ORF Transcript_8464/g.12624 Transcript_8464/m.12624 type:complete len:1331 (-) Transcript_8464:69-4061(-)|eukprot:CAMPEP_0185038116 /NCGR_PEP_ID=MMETSP1103-20130426/33370_1 /TAXON_ID=36769 /ORGANISM="Paraphysomonas bandaiensis, Strain Caron Lab Isolate" /LENGTH=1330 /DNA_ID=CAMNT_0027576403 /DNA_START=23 /DNA_END=4015 /DNA_ORIENTATION=-